MPITGEEEEIEDEAERNLAGDFSVYGSNMVSPLLPLGGEGGQEVTEPSREEYINMTQISDEHLVNPTLNSVATDYGRIPKVRVSDEKRKRRQFWALVGIRFRIARRNKLVIFTRVVLPVIFIVVGAFLDRFVEQALQRDSGSHSPSPLEMDAGMYTYVRGQASAAANPNATLQFTGTGN